MKKIIFLFLSYAVAAMGQSPTPSSPARPIPTPPPMAFDSLLATPTVWDMSPSALLQNPMHGFRWMSVTHDETECTLKNTTLFGQPICQTVIRFYQEKPKEIAVVFYDRGDSGQLDKPKYEQLIKDLSVTISTLTKTPSVPRGRDATSAVRAEGLIWNTPDSKYLLEYSCTKTPQIPFRAEFIRLSITPIEKSKSGATQPFSTPSKGPFNGPSHVSRSPNGDVLAKDIPMVDQGQKGYCVVATAERVLRYYGVKVDENELAQIANSDSKKGTHVASLIDSLVKLTARLRIRVRTIYQLRLEDVINQYNDAAKRSKDDSVFWNYSSEKSDDPNAKIHALLSQMKPDVLRQGRAKDRAGRSSFTRHLKEHIDIGIPVLWSVIVGVMPETPALHGYGTHMRLLIGYNEKTDEVFYSDSWGMGHELKRMPAADAWAITMELATIEPLSSSIN